MMWFWVLTGWLPPTQPLTGKRVQLLWTVWEVWQVLCCLDCQMQLLLEWNSVLCTLLGVVRKDLVTEGWLMLL